MSMVMTRPLRKTDLPEPVVPATSRCGSEAMSTITGFALGVAAGGPLERTALDVGHEVAEVDGLRLLVGNLDAHERGAGMGAKMRTEREASDRAMSSVRFVILLTRSPSAHLDLEGGHGGAGDPAHHMARQTKLQYRVLKLLGDPCSSCFCDASCRLPLSSG